MEGGKGSVAPAPSISPFRPCLSRPALPLPLSVSPPSPSLPPPARSFPFPCYGYPARAPTLLWVWVCLGAAGIG